MTELHATTADVVDRGFVEFHCREHGVLVVTFPNATVHCRCGLRARPTLNGTPLDGRDIDRMRKTPQKPLQIRGSISRNPRSDGLEPAARVNGRERPRAGL